MAVSFRVKLLASHAAVALVVGAVTLVIVERQVSRRMEQQLDQRLEAQASAVAQWLERAAHPNQLARRLAGVVDARVTILDEQGIAVGESLARMNSRPGMDSEGHPNEIRAAREGKVGRETRYSAFDAQPVRYVAVPAPNNLVVRLGAPLGNVDELKADLRRQLIVAAVVSVLVALLLAALVVGPLTRRLRDATALARRIGSADYDVPAVPPARDEIGVLSNTLATAAKALRANEQRRREFLANVAHEIRTPVTSIRGYAQILSSSPVDAETNREFLQSIHRNSVRIGDLVEDLLELEALEAGKGSTLARDRVTVTPIVQHAIATLRANASDRAATISIDMGENVEMLGDADAIERIVLNLVDNAFRHGGDGVKVTITARHDARTTSLIVSDTGSGIPPEHRASIFDRFQRGSADRDVGRHGTGLGLAIARELAHAMNGSLVLEGSSTFILELPS